MCYGSPSYPGPRFPGIAGIPFNEEYELSVHYKGDKIGLRRVDFWIDNTVSVEIKAKSELDNTHLAQAINYIEASNISTGLLINFGTTSLQFRRIHNKLLFPLNPDESQKS
jgi:GxxExxY protein